MRAATSMPQMWWRAAGSAAAARVCAPQTSYRQAWRCAASVTQPALGCHVDQQVAFAIRHSMPLPELRQRALPNCSAKIVRRLQAEPVTIQGRRSGSRAGREHRFVEAQTGVAKTPAAEAAGVRPIEDAPADVLTFGDVSPERIRTICQASVPGWSEVSPDDISVDQLCEGLSNQNFKVYLPNSKQQGLTQCVLFRIYGKDAGALYDLEAELEVCRLLASYQIGPLVFASGTGWRIEEWHFSVPLPNRRMRNPSIFVQVASNVGRLHKISSRSDFPSHIRQRPVLSTQRLDSWSEGCREAAASFQHPEQLKQLEAINIEEVLAEKDWIMKFLVADDPKIRGSGLDKVFCHWDCQENNILQTHYGLRFIDFEYSGMDYQAFDIATYFVECAIDYIVKDHPFYKVSQSDFPTEHEQRLFCSIYLSEYLETVVRPDDLAVTVLVERVNRFVLLVHYIWTLWSVIRSPQAPTFNDFDYLQFGQSRWHMYKWAKFGVLHTGAAKG